MPPSKNVSLLNRTLIYASCVIDLTLKENTIVTSVGISCIETVLTNFYVIMSKCQSRKRSFNREIQL